MRTPGPRPGPHRRLRLPRRTARLRLTVLYGAAFLACGAAVLAVVAYLLYGPTTNQPSSSHLNSSASAVLHGRVPIADVHQAGPYDIVKVPLKVPIADVHQAGRYDILSYRTPVAASPVRQKPPVLTAAEQAKLLAEAQFHVNYDKRQILIICAIALAGIALAAAAIGWVIAGRVLRPLSTITAAARRIAASNLHERLALHGPDDELTELADTLDNLFARLEASFDAQRRFAANASHELRTPLTRERALLQVTLADPAATTGTWQAVSRELLASNAEQERLIEALLTLASSEAGPGEREPVDLAALTSAALDAARPAISRLGLNVRADLQPASFDGDPLLAQQLAANLIGNAVRHNSPGGEVQVATGTSRDHAVLSVTNSGPVIPAAEVDRLFQPFQRLGPGRARRDGGHGLGLSIVRAIATAHGAAISARPVPGG
ncbi:MAG: sensor histidine kinase, partial [Streptosporangiaceae bacterium]